MTKDTEETADDRRAREVRLSDATVHFLEQRIAVGVQKGLREAMTEETAATFWLAGLNVLQKSASDHAGRWVIGGLMGLIRKAGLFILLGGVVYAMGGWSAMAALVKILFGGEAIK